MGATKYPGPGIAGSAEGGADSLGAGPIQEAADPFEVHLGDQRADLDVVTGAGFAYHQGADFADQVVGELCGDRLVHQHPAAGTAFLPGVPGGAQRRRRFVDQQWFDPRDQAHPRQRAFGQRCLEGIGARSHGAGRPFSARVRAGRGAWVGLGMCAGL